MGLVKCVHYFPGTCLLPLDELKKMGSGNGWIPIVTDYGALSPNMSHSSMELEIVTLTSGYGYTSKSHMYELTHAYTHAGRFVCLSV